jgi:hypothetical protein
VWAADWRSLDWHSPARWPHRYQTYGFEPPPSAAPWRGYGGASLLGPGAATASTAATAATRSVGNSGGHGRETVVLVPGLDGSTAYFRDRKLVSYSSSFDFFTEASRLWAPSLKQYSKPVGMCAISECHISFFFILFKNLVQLASLCVAAVVPELTAAGLKVVVFYLPLATPAGTAYPHPPLPSPLPHGLARARARAAPLDGSAATPAALAAEAGAAAGASGSRWSAFGRGLWGSSGVSGGDGEVAGTAYDLDYISAELQRVLLELQLVR